MLVAPGLILFEEKSEYYVLFFYVDDPSKYIYVRVFCTKMGLTESIMMQIIPKLIYYSW